LRDAHDFAHTFEEFEVAVVEIAMDAYGAEDGVGFAGGAVDIKAAADEAIDNVLDLGVGGAFLHYDDHEVVLIPFRVPREGGEIHASDSLETVPIGAQ
jgi:hypothetical protein